MSSFAITALLIGFPGAFFVAGVLVGLGGLRLWLKTQSAKQWPSVPGVVKSVEVRVSTDEDGTKFYEPYITYQYMVDKQRLESTRFSTGNTSSMTYPGQKRRVETQVGHYAVGQLVQVYYNPKRPTETVLQIKAAGCGGTLFAAMLLLAVGGVGLAGAIYLLSL